MAWYAELKRRRWYCIVEMDAIHAYKKKLHDDWWESLTPEEREHVLDLVEKKRQRERDEAKQAVQQIMLMNETILNLYLRK